MDFVSAYLAGEKLSTSEAWFYARKVNVAATQDWADYIQKRGVNNWLEEQLNPERIQEDPQYEKERKAIFPSTFIDPPGNITRDFNFWNTYQPKNKNHPYDVSVYVIQSALHRMWRSKKQLQATMALFWADMLATNIKKSPEGYHDYVALLFNGALGKYRDMLYNITTCQTMSYFLDNNTNTRYALNENMGRELMELHSWGEQKGYSQADVVAVAKLLTGVRGHTQQEFTEARPDLHEFGPMTVAGKTFQNSGSTPDDVYKTVRELTDYLARDRYTGLRIARRLIQFFVGQDDPYESLAQRLATTYVSNDTDIRPVLRELLTSAEFRASGGKTIRRPWTVLCSLMASGNLQLNKASNNLSNTDTMHKPLYKMFVTLKYSTGGVPFDAPATNGYSLDAADWINSVTYAGLSKFNRYTNYVSKWDGGSADSLARWASPIDWASRTGVKIGSTKMMDAAKMVFRYLTGFELTNTEVVNAIASYATAHTEQAALSGAPSGGVVANKDQLNRMVEATLTAPHFLIS